MPLVNTDSANPSFLALYSQVNGVTIYACKTSILAIQEELFDVKKLDLTCKNIKFL